MPKKSLLDLIDILAPCPEVWDEMTGDDKNRFCGSCERDIYNLSEMTRKEAQKLLFESKERVCVRMEREPNGRIKTLKKQFHQITRQTSIAAGVLSATLAVSTITLAQIQPEIGTTTATLGTKNREKTSKKKQRNLKTSTISFTVYDPRGVVIADAEVEVSNHQTNQQFNIRSDEKGIAQFNSLPIGSYSLEISSPGFPKHQQIIRLREPVEPNININLLLPFIGEIVTIEDEIPVFQAIAQDNNVEVVKAISSGFNINTKNINGQTALHIAVESGNLEITQFLLSKNIKVDVKDKKRRTPLLMIEDNFKETTLEIVKLLITKGANVNVQNKWKQTALIVACDEENTEIVKILLKAGANPNIKDSDGETAFDKTDSQEIKNLLIKFGAKNTKK